MRFGRANAPHRLSDRCFPSSVALVLGAKALLIDTCAASSLALEVAIAAVSKATMVPITADVRCSLSGCKLRRPIATFGLC